jgi:hypothetical protein
LKISIIQSRVYPNKRCGRCVYVTPFAGNFSRHGATKPQRSHRLFITAPACYTTSHLWGFVFFSLAFIWGNHNGEIQANVYLRFSSDRLEYYYSAGTRGNLEWREFKSRIANEQKPAAKEGVRSIKT